MMFTNPRNRLVQYVFPLQPFSKHCLALTRRGRKSWLTSAKPLGPVRLLQLRDDRDVFAFVFFYFLQKLFALCGT